MAEIKNMVEQTTTTEKEVPFIQRVIDGRVYTVNIHFKADSRETAKDKVIRLLKQEAEGEMMSA